MRTQSRFRNLWQIAGLVLLIAARPVSAEIIDRIAVSVGNQVITEDQINEEIRLTAFLNHEKVDTSSSEKKKTAERLIEQTLIKRDIDFSRYPLPQMSDADESFRGVASQYAGEPQFQEALQKYRLTEEDLRRHLWWQLVVLRFVDSRFRAGIQIPDADLRAYYDQEATKLREQGVEKIPAFEDSREKIEQLLTQQRTDQAVDRWLGDTRTQVEIRYHSGVFQ